MLMSPITAPLYSREISNGLHQRPEPFIPSVKFCEMMMKMAVEGEISVVSSKPQRK